MDNLIDVVIFQLEVERAGICDLLANCPGEDVETGKPVFDVTDLRGSNYFEFAKLPDYEPTLRVRVAPNQIWTEDKEDLPFHLTEKLKNECIPYIMSRRKMMSIDQFAAQQPMPVELPAGDIFYRHR